MPVLSESLQGRDLGHLRIIAELWGIELEAPDARTAMQKLIPALLDATAVEALIGSLSPEVKLVLSDLARHAGRIPWAQFTRKYGMVREMGAGKRDRERPYLQPISPVEALWYRALVANAFFDTPSGAEEFAYIPDDLLPLIPAATGEAAPPMGRQASSAEYAQIFPVDGRLLDHACTLLAALRLGIAPPEVFSSPPSQLLSALTLQTLLATAGLLDDSGVPLPDPVRTFLEIGRGEALAQIMSAWMRSTGFNELRLLPNLKAEGKWVNDPLRARQTILGFLSGIPAGTWWSMSSFVAAIKQRNPDFQRPAGDYDSWFIRDERSGEFLRGFEHWDEVDGALIRYILTGPLHWLGVLDLASSTPEAEVTAFRFSEWSAMLLQGEPPRGMALEDEPLLVRSDARVRALSMVPRVVRYQVARFCEWEKETPDEYQYRITPASLARARQQGLTVGHLLALLTRHAKVIPPSLLKALERWDQHGSEARAEKLVVLRVSSPEVLQALRKSRAARFLGDPLAPTAVVVKAGATEKVLAALAELGYLGEARLDPGDA